MNPLPPSFLPSWDPADQTGLRAEVAAPDSGLTGPLSLSRLIITLLPYWSDSKEGRQDLHILRKVTAC